MSNFLRLIAEANKHLRKYAYCLPVNMEKLSNGGTKIVYRDDYSGYTVEEYWLDGKYHRTDGPAIHYNKDSDMDEYWLHGKQFTKDEYLKHFDTD